MRKGMSIVVVVMLIISMIPNLAFAVDLQTEADELKLVFDELTDEDKSALSDTKAEIYDLSKDNDHEVWNEVFKWIPVDDQDFIDEFGSEAEAKEFVREFIADFTTIYFITTSDELAGELEDFVDEYKDKFTAIFGSDGEELLRDLQALMLDALSNPGNYIDGEDVDGLAGANTNEALVDEIKEILKDIISAEALEDNIQDELDKVGWEAGNIVEAAFALIKEADPTKRASLALANAMLRSKGEVASGDTTPTVGTETIYSISFFGQSTNLLRFKLADSTKGSFATNNKNPLTPTQIGDTTVYVYRTSVDLASEPWNYIYKFDITIQEDSGGGDDGGGGGGGSTPTEEPEDQGSQPVTTVDSKDVKTTVTKVNGQEVAEITVDNNAIKKIVQQSEKGTTVVIEVDEDADVVEAGFDGDMISLMEKNDISISIETDTASYTIPAKDLDIGELVNQLGEDVDPSDITLSIVIAEPSPEEIKVIQDQAVENGLQIVIPPIEFDVVCKHGEESVTVSKFNSFVERTIKVPAGVDPKEITTAVVQDKEGNLTPVPTEVVQIDGEYYVKIKSMTNSVYTVISNNKQFSDVENHWAKDDVNDMGSRLIINGVSDTIFEPDRDITRAEFMAIVVRALGIMRTGEGQDVFDDVKADAWYYDAVSIAKNYGITNGNGNGTFSPNSKITREEAMAMTARAMKIAEINTDVSENEIETVLGGFADKGNISEWAKECVSTCVKNDIIGGYDGKIFAKDNITRAECAAIIKRTLLKAGLIE